MSRTITDAHVLSGAALLVPALGLVAPLGLAPLLAGVALALIAVEPHPARRLSRSVLPLAVLLALTALWGAISAGWSIIPGHSLFEATRLVLLSAGGLVAVSAGIALAAPGRRMVGRAALAGIALGLAVILVELAFNYPIRRALSGSADRVFPLAVLDRGAVVMALSCWVAILHLVERRHLAAAGLLLAATGYALLNLFSIGAVIGLFGGAAVFAVAWWRPRRTAQLLIAGFIVLAVAMPFLPPTRGTVIWLGTEAPWLRTSALHRLIIWRFTSDRIAEHPVLGWGMDASREMPGGKTDIRNYIGLEPGTLRELTGGGAVMPLHPHDAILQWWGELGILGAALGTAVFAWTTWRAGTWQAPARAAAAAALAVVAASISPLLLSFGVWQAWWQSTLWLIAALLIAVATPSGPAAAAPGGTAREPARP